VWCQQKSLDGTSINFYANGRLSGRGDEILRSGRQGRSWHQSFTNRACDGEYEKQWRGVADSAKLS
jgi:hypothetical protein